MRKIAKLSAILPILGGLVVGITLFILGNADDSPGLSLIGVVAGFLMILWGIYNAGIVKKTLLMPIILLSFGCGGILTTTVLLIDGEFEQAPTVPIFGIVAGVVMIGIGIFMLRGRRK